MPLTVNQSIIIFSIISITTILIRVIPFILFPEHKETPKYIMYLGKVLPYTIIGMLVIYCLKDISFTTSPFGLPEIVSVLVIAVLHIWKGNTLLSIGTGTILYMLLVQFIF
jgi:branched-subunit amino acid transport protein AzlD